MADDIVLSVEANIRIVRGMCEGGNGVFHDACLAVCDEIERLRAAGDALVDAMKDRTHRSRSKSIQAWKEARRG